LFGISNLSLPGTLRKMWLDAALPANAAATPRRTASLGIHNIRSARLLSLLALGSSLLGAQQDAAARTPRTEGGILAGVALTGFSQSYPGGTASATGNAGTEPYLGVFVRRTITRALHAEAEAVLEVIRDDGANFAMGFAQFPVLLEFVALPTGPAHSFVRPSFHIGLSPGVRLNATGGRGGPAPLRAAELSGVVGVGAEVHFGTSGWIQLAGRIRYGLTDLSPLPGTTRSTVIAVLMKLHPEHRD